MLAPCMLDTSKQLNQRGAKCFSLIAWQVEAIKLHQIVKLKTTGVNLIYPDGID